VRAKPTQEGQKKKNKPSRGTVSALIVSSDSNDDSSDSVGGNSRKPPSDRLDGATDSAESDSSVLTF
jgi:hypothetical protein